MRRSSFPQLRKTEDFLRTLGYSERSVRDIVGASRREIVRDRALLELFGGTGRKRKPEGGGGAPCML